MPAKTPPFPNYPLWTTARFYSFLRSALRAAYSRYPVKYEVLKEARSPYKGKDKRTKWIYRCAVCGKTYKQTGVTVDHIIPAGALNSFQDLPGFVERLFCGKEGLQVLCSKDHAEKTRIERSK